MSIDTEADIKTATFKELEARTGLRIRAWDHFTREKCVYADGSRKLTHAKGKPATGRMGRPPRTAPLQLALDVAKKRKANIELAKQGKSGLHWEEQADGSKRLYRSPYAARRAYPDAGFTADLLWQLAEQPKLLALGGAKLVPLVREIPNGPKGELQEVKVYDDEHLRAMDEWERAKRRLYGKWDGKPDHVDREGGWLVGSRCREFGLHPATVHFQAVYKKSPHDALGRKPRGKPFDGVKGATRGRTMLFHGLDLLAMADPATQRRLRTRMHVEMFEAPEAPPANGNGHPPQEQAKPAPKPAAVPTDYPQFHGDGCRELWEKEPDKFKPKRYFFGRFSISASTINVQKLRGKVHAVTVSYRKVLFYVPDVERENADRRKM